MTESDDCIRCRRWDTTASRLFAETSWKWLLLKAGYRGEIAGKVAFMLRMKIAEREDYSASNYRVVRAFALFLRRA
jgi:hypothetical protein